SLRDAAAAAPPPRRPHGQDHQRNVLPHGLAPRTGGAHRRGRGGPRREQARAHDLHAAAPLARCAGALGARGAHGLRPHGRVPRRARRGAQSAARRGHRPAEPAVRRPPSRSRGTEGGPRRRARGRRSCAVPHRDRPSRRHPGRRTAVDRRLHRHARRSRLRLGRRRALIIRPVPGIGSAPRSRGERRAARGSTPMTESTPPTASADRGPSTGTYAAGHRPRSPWPALWALVIGFFMLLVDTTIVSVANPAIKAALDPDSNNLDRVVWVTSAYLLAYAVPLLITGRLGDRFGPKTIYLIGLAVFTAASLWCGLSTTLEGLIAARAVQGLGAAFMTPETMAVITRTFPPHRRGAAMGLWGGTSGVAMLVGPLAGGFLVDGLGWEWIFFINLPVGIVGFVLACILVPTLETHKHRFDIPGVSLSAIAMFLIVFGLQEAEAYDWGVIWGPISVWGLIIAGVVVLGLFLWYQSRTKNEPLVPMELFRNRNLAWSNIRSEERRVGKECRRDRVP